VIIDAIRKGDGFLEIHSPSNGRDDHQKISLFDLCLLTLEKANIFIIDES
jgi:hypothetical protein